MDDIIKTMKISSAGMRAQSARLKVISENLANANSLAQGPNGKPYRRKIITFFNELDRKMGLQKVQVRKITSDMSAFGKKFDPQHPAADQDGYVLTPNVNTLIEMTDMREAQRSYEANMEMIKASKSMLSGTIEVLKR